LIHAKVAARESQTLIPALPAKEFTTREMPTSVGAIPGAETVRRLISAVPLI
jgi:hypothetical protein